jgi:hypothetical protein
MLIIKTKRIIFVKGVIMKYLLRFTTVLFVILYLQSVTAQTNLDPAAYARFLQSIENLSTSDFLANHAPSSMRYTERSDTQLDKFAFLDSIQDAYQLTDDELELLKSHHFVITERLKYPCFGEALHDIFGNDLPLFITTDIILHALHTSYDKILMKLEISQLQPKLIQILEALNSSYPTLWNTYQANPQMANSLKDVDLYLTIARSLIQGEQLAANIISDTDVKAVWDAIQAETYTEMALFTKRSRKFDFSQFTPRGHYTQEIWSGTGFVTLENYFKTMMWLGRIDFLLTPTADNPLEEPWPEEEIQRMTIDAVLLNELLDIAAVREPLKEIDQTIEFLVGESDNLTPTELADITKDQNIERSDELLNQDTYHQLKQTLYKSPECQQKILSCFLIMNPFSAVPDTLPVSYRLMGQRFIIDSYIFSNVVYDRIVYQGAKIWRPMPDPLDAMFALGNDDAGYLMQADIEQYHYATQLEALRYLVDSYQEDFWNLSLYNTWLDAIRLLNPPADNSNLPFFMQTVAWHQEKLNTQLASWSQLRHDNLLYAKQSYTGGTLCSFPHSFVEPYPQFYQKVGEFARKAYDFFQLPYFQRLDCIMDTLTTLAEKELDQEPFTESEKSFLQRMLFLSGGSGAPPFTGWFADLFYDPYNTVKHDYVIADVHTQPTDAGGSVVGRVLHVGVGEVNLGIFLANSPSSDYQPMAYVGPVMSFYETITENWDRLTDERWQTIIQNNELPQRPDWVNIYLADTLGNTRVTGRELEGRVYASSNNSLNSLPDHFSLLQNYPNPFNPFTTIRFELPEKSQVRLEIYNILGQKIITLINEEKTAGAYYIKWNGKDLKGIDVSSGIYLYKMTCGNSVQIRKMVLSR